MFRLTITLVAWLGIVAVASASLTPRNLAPKFGVEDAQPVKLSTKSLEQAARGGAASPYVMTERTEVLLDGRPCKYADVPAQARIVRMEVAADQRTVLKIHFRSGK
jgi:hypothetical protein